MQIQIIPTANDPFYTQVTALSGVDYRLSFQYNQREQAWYLTIADIEDNIIFRGLKLVCNWPLYGNLRHASLPPGQLIVMSNSTDHSTPGLDDLIDGGRCQMCYVIP